MSFFNSYFLDDLKIGIKRIKSQIIKKRKVTSIFAIIIGLIICIPAFFPLFFNVNEIYEKTKIYEQYEEYDLNNIEDITFNATDIIKPEINYD